MNQNIDEEQKKATGKVIEYFLSKEVQLKYLNEKMKYSGMLELYDDERCNKLYSSIFKSLQFINNISNLVGKKAKYINKIKYYINEYIYGNATSKDTLQFIDYIINIYEIDYGSVYGKIIIFVISLILYTIASSSLLLFINKYNVFLNTFENKFWIVILLGLGLFSTYGFLIIGRVTLFKCLTKTNIIFLSISLYFHPLLIKLINNFPVKNVLIDFNKRHNFLSLILLLLIDVISLSLLYIYPPYKVSELYVDGGMNYNICEIKNTFFTIYLSLLIFIRVLEYLLISFLTFVEWNTERIYRDIRIIATVQYISLLFAIFLLIINIIRIKNIYVNTILKFIFSILYSVANFIVIFWMNLYLTMSDVKSLNQSLKIKKNGSDEEKRISKRNSNKQKMNIKSKILEMHYSSNDIGEPNKNKDGLEIVLYTGVMLSDQVTDISSEDINQT